MRLPSKWDRAAILIGVIGAMGVIGCNGSVGPAGDTGATGAPGAKGDSCTSVDNANGTYTISCADGTSVTLSDGQVGVGCTVVDNGNTSTVTCDGTSTIIPDGTPGTDGTACTVVDNGDGTKTISCTDGTSVTVSDGTRGPAGVAGFDPKVNYVAIHDPMAPQFDGDCVACHVDQDIDTSLDSASAVSFHARKLTSTVFMTTIGATTENEACNYCHKTFDLSYDRSAADLRRRNAVANCAICHIAGTYTFYQGL